MTTDSPQDQDQLSAALRHHQLCIVAHRLPLQHSDDEGWQRSPGGLVSALEPALEESGGRWFGYVRRGEPPHPRQGHAEFIGLELDHRTRTEAIDGCCNRTLWPALHGIDDVVEESDAWWDSYFAHNDRTAAEVACRAQAGALIWVHDYHFFAFARELKRLRRDLRVGLFCHTTIEAGHLHALSRGPELLRHMSRFDMIGTQTDGDARRLREQFDLAGIGDGVPVHTVPVGIDVDQWTRYREDPEVDRQAMEMAAGRDGLLAVGIDRADYTKGLIAKFLAFETALEHGSISPDDLRLIQVAVPTRSGIAAYDRIVREMTTVAARINERFTRSDGHSVVSVSTEARSPEEVAILMRAADLMLVTPLRDGMNLVALESAVVNADRAVEVILSRGAGAAAYIGAECRLVTGGDVPSIADALESAVHDPSTCDRRGERSRRRGRAAEMLSARRWVGTYTSLLVECDLGSRAFAHRAPGVTD
jgi:trehalose 6-phosphate synthase